MVSAQSRSSAVYVVDDDRGFLEAAGRCLRFAGLSVLAFRSAEAFLEAYSDAQPGCLVTDVRMPGLSGLELAARLAESGYPIPVVFVNGHGDVPMAVQALQHGAVDFLEKPFRADVLLDSVQRALERDLQQRRLAARRTGIEARYASLTAREREVFDSLAANEPAKRIAARLGVSPRTVEHHREHLMAKLGARSRHDVLVMALLLGRFHPP